jgi:LysR family transcriptional regulator, glycine cleavage system transcriptional activator
MHKPLPPLNALRAFEAAARHLSLTKAALELHVTAGALSHQIRGLEDLLGLKLFERRVRSLALTQAGERLYPGLQLGFVHIREAVAVLGETHGENILVVSCPPGFTSKWLVPRLYRFSTANPAIDTRVSSTLTLANFTADGVDIAVRILPADAGPKPGLALEKLMDFSFVPVCSPRLIERLGPLSLPDALKGMPLIHDDSSAHPSGTPKWSEWFKEAGLTGADSSRGLHFSSADHALEAAVEGAGLLLALDALAYDELRTGRLAVAAGLVLHSGRAYYLVCTKGREKHPKVTAFRNWIKQEIVAIDWGRITVPAARQ